ncbi:MAG TPA: hypothetical protein VHL11_16050 [Phototrophicaceae bacterium]|jgi:hypothetical protein|nr:hypothetical protein [Phototrophicaceae bacterium]
MSYTAAEYPRNSDHEYCIEPDFLIFWSRLAKDALYIMHSDNTDVCTFIFMEDKIFKIAADAFDLFSLPDAERWMAVIKRTQQILDQGFHFTPTE